MNPDLAFGCFTVTAALDFNYCYNQPSYVGSDQKGRSQLELATFNPNPSPDFFFEGQLLKPRLIGQILFALSEVVRTRFWEPIPMGYSLLDPVVTSHPDVLRLEGFSGCCGVYARADLPTDLFEADLRGRGTTNVDFNADIRRGFQALRDGEDARLAVGNREVVLSRENDRIVEKKVRLPLRWIKGFSEAQAYITRLEPRAEVSAAHALRFVRTLPRSSAAHHSTCVVPSARGLRTSQRPVSGSVPVSGTHRLKILEPLLLQAQSLRIWLDPSSGASAWEVRFETGAFFLLLSPELKRGFSGEGQILKTLANPPAEAFVAQVRAKLAWQAIISPDALAASLNTECGSVEAALAVIGSRGLAGFDANSGHYYHRELPFDLSQVEAMQPRLKAARKLLEAQSIRSLSHGKLDQQIFEVEGSGTVHRVRLSKQGTVCTCPWFSTHQGQRGPCKHALAAQMFAADQNTGAAA